jgi:hypothetical protein
MTVEGDERPTERKQGRFFALLLRKEQILKLTKVTCQIAISTQVKLGSKSSERGHQQTTCHSEKYHDHEVSDWF